MCEQSADVATASTKPTFTRVRVIAEGAGALSVAAALTGRAGGGRVACIVSGGNIDSAVLCRILAGETP
jgi:threonine dehydratase